MHHLVLEPCHCIKESKVYSYGYMYKYLLCARQYAKPVAEIWPLYTNTKWNLRDRVLGEAGEKKTKTKTTALLLYQAKEAMPSKLHVLTWRG